jgi:hypothetical protein
LLLFTDYVPDIYMRYDIGYAIIGIVLLDIVINLVIMVIETFRTIKLFIAMIKKRFIKRKRLRYYVHNKP